MPDVPDAARAAKAAAPRPLATLSGPKAWPLIGNLLQFDLPRLHLQLEGWVARYGNPYRLRLARHDALVLADPAAIAAVMRARPDTWRRRATFEPILRELGSHGVFSAEGDDWRRQRRLVMAAFDPSHLRRFMPRLVQVTERLRDRWSRAAAAGSFLDLQPELMRYSVDAGTGLAFGVDFNTIEDERSELQEHLAEMFPMLYRRINLPWPYWRYVKLPVDRVFDRHVAAIHRTIDDLVARARQRLERDPRRIDQPGDLLEAMLAARDADGSALSQDEITGNVFTILGASEDTTANSLAWTVYLLFTHPPAWKRLVGEADALLGAESMPRQLAEARALSYAEACVREAMRLRPVAPLVFLDAVHDTQVRDVAVPRGTTLFCLMRPGAVNEAAFSDAHEYRPERWLDGDAALVPQGAALRKASMPFGGGPRLCPGRYLAMLEMSMVLAMLARNFELRDVSTADGAPPAERLTFTMHPVGLRMRLAEREAAR